MSVTIREQQHQRTCPFGQFSIICRTVTTKRTSTKLTVCILSPHPLVLSEFERILAKSQFKVIIKQLESTLAPDLRTLEPPKAQVYVIDAHAAKPATGALLANLLENLSNKEIASKLNIAERTVKFHVSNLLNKFGVRRRADLILLTFQRRLSQA